MVFASCSFGQAVHLVRDTSIAVFRNNIRLENAWSPGMNSASFAVIDLDGNGKMDLIHYDAPSMRLNTYINSGLSGASSYKYAPEFANYFPAEIEGWVKTFDYDFDGDMDLFTYNGGGIALYRNDFSPVAGLQFTSIVNQIQTHYGGFQTNIYASRVNAPAISDLDNDGDMDILAFSISGSWVEHHRNFSVDSLVAPGVLKIYNVPVCWGYFVLSNSGNYAQLPPVLPTCPLLAANPVRMNSSLEKRADVADINITGNLSSRHSGSSLLVLDMDGDGDKDVLNGDILGTNLLYLENCGDPDSAWICSQDTAFPSYNIPVSMRDVVSPHYFDGNNDGLNDLIAGSFYFNTEDYQNVKFYRNTTNNQSNVFNYVTDRWLVDGMIEVGTGAHPVFFDVDQDGKKDLLIGNDYYFNNGSPVGKIAYYKNTGSAGGNAQFTWITDDFNGLSSLGLLALHPTFGDIDGDGDDDMLLGQSDGTLLLYLNIAGAGNPCVFILSQVNYQSINVGDNAAPQIVDVDRDGLSDLIIGERSGVLNYYRNTGSLSVPVFTFISGNFGGVDVTKANSFAGFSVPLLFDNGSGYELLVGSLSGYIYHYNGIDGNLSGSFTMLDSMFQDIYEPAYASPAMNDVDGDGRFDLLVGVLSGGVVLYTQNPLLTDIQAALPGVYFELFPNPAVNAIQISLYSEDTKGILVEIYDVCGSLVKRQRNPGRTTNIDISALMPGMYVCRVLNGEKSFSQRFVKQ